MPMPYADDAGQPEDHRAPWAEGFAVSAGMTDIAWSGPTVFGGDDQAMVTGRAPASWRLGKRLRAGEAEPMVRLAVSRRKDGTPCLMPGMEVYVRVGHPVAIDAVFRGSANKEWAVLTPQAAKRMLKIRR